MSARRSHHGRAAALAIGCVLCDSAACARPAQPPVVPILHTGPAARFTSAEQLLAAVSRCNDGYSTLRSVHKVVIEISTDDGRREAHSCMGVLAVQRPDRFRLVALGPAGMKIFDLLYSKGEARALSVGPHIGSSTLLAQILRSVAQDVRAMYRLAPRPARDRMRLESGYATTNRAPLFEVTGYDGSRQVDQLSVFAASLAVARTEEIDANGDPRTITFGDYERHGKLLVPRSILVAREGRLSYWISIQVQQVEIDPELDARLFAAP